MLAELNNWHMVSSQDFSHERIKQEQQVRDPSVVSDYGASGE